jgi:hypothetical protein
MADDQQMITGLTGGAAASETPQFATAEYAHIPNTERCRICNGAISGEYFRVNSQMACGKCAQEAREGQPSDSHAAFARGLLMGMGAALVGLIIYSTFAIATGMTIGYLALVVGWLVAKGMMKGSNGMGGRRYQIAAVLLTYAAISLSAIPIWITVAVKDAKAKTHPATQSAVSSSSVPGPGTVTKSDDQQALSPPRAISLRPRTRSSTLWEH